MSVGLDPAFMPREESEDWRSRMSAVERRVSALERGGVIVATQSGAPTDSAPAGATRVSETPLRLWVRTPGGGWAYTGLT